MKRILLCCSMLVSLMASHAATITLTVDSTRYQKITGFGAAGCYGAMEPLDETLCIQLLYGKNSNIGLNIMRMEISPSFQPDNWGNYDWHGSLAMAKEVKRRGGIVFGTPWSPPGEYKTNGISGGGNSEDQGYQRGTLREDCYEKFFPWINTFLKYMKDNGVAVDAVSLQNEPDWWVNYSGCVYTPEQLHKLVKDYAHLLDRETYGVRLISGESLNFNPIFSDILLNDPATRKHIDIIGGHLYGTPPLKYMAQSAQLAAKYDKEVWMTEHSCENAWDASVNGPRKGLPNWHEQLLFAEEVNESLLAGGTAYIYWYMRADWAFLPAKKGNSKLMKRAYVMSHFAKNVTGSTRLGAKASVKIDTNSAFQASAFIKGDSLIVMAIDTTKNAFDLKINLPYHVKSGTHWLSTEALTCKKTPLEIPESQNVVVVPLEARSVNTYIFKIDREAAAISELSIDHSSSMRSEQVYDLQGRRQSPSSHGLRIRKLPDGRMVKVFQ